jgi:hypothetical protein
MTSMVNGLRLRKVMGRDLWRAPRPFGPDGWKMDAAVMCDDLRTPFASVIASCSDFPGYDCDIVHASIAYADGVTMPTYGELVLLHRAVFDDGYAYQCFLPAYKHINIHPTALHLWGRVDGKPMMPEFGMFGSI